MADNTRPAVPAAPITPEEQVALGAPLLPGSRSEIGRIAQRRDRLLAALTLIAGIGLVLGTPFALKSGAEFFLPLTAALVIAIALVPVLEWLERRRLPSAVAALLCVLVFLVIANIAIAAIVVPATDFFQLLPSRISRIQHNLSPLLDLYSTLEKSVNKL
ncbi:MAG: AI-2E family transporter, partial [Sphingomonas sp.]